MNLYEKNIKHLSDLQNIDKKDVQTPDGELIPVGELAKTYVQRIKAALRDKLAEAKEPMPEHPAWTLGKAVAGGVTGMGAGYLGAKGLDYLLKQHGYPVGMPAMARDLGPALGMIAGMVTPYATEKLVQHMRENTLKRQELKARGKAT